MSSQLVPYVDDDLATRMQYIKTLSSGGSMIPAALCDNGVPNPGKILVVTETGAMLGLQPMAALAGIHVIEGKASISAGMMSALVRAAGFKLRVKSTGSMAARDLAVTATLIRPDDPDEPFVATWTVERAARAKLMGKDNWVKYTEAMLKARAISEVCREGAEDVLKGIHYTPEELEHDLTDAGELVPVKDAEPSEDWPALIADAKHKQVVTDIIQRAREAGEFNDKVRTAALTKLGMLDREEPHEQPQDPEPEQSEQPGPVEPDEIVNGEVVEDVPSDDDPVVEPPRQSWPVRTIPTSSMFPMDTPPFGGDAA